MSNYNNPNPNLPLGMMQQQGFMTAGSSPMGQNQQSHFGNIGMAGSGNTPNPGMGGSGMMGTGFGQHQNQSGISGGGGSMVSAGYGSSMSQNQNSTQAQQPGIANTNTAASAAAPTPMDTSSSNPQPQQSQQTKELNAASLCRFGVETVQEIVSRTQDVFQTLRAAQPPDGKASTAALDRKPKFQETLKNIRALFKRLRVIYDKMEESFPTSSDSYFEDSLPFKDGPEITILDEKKNTEAYQLASVEHREMMEVLLVKNNQLRETLDHLRQIIWDVNTMLAMRKE